MTNYIHPLQQHTISQGQIKQRPKNAKSQSFQDVLTEVQSLKISRHAEERLKERNIHLNFEEWNLINEKISEAKRKGVTDALVVMDDITLIVSAENKTVVTAMNKADANNKVFTNINGTILL